MLICFLATRPETVISIVQVGRLPDNLPDYLEPKEMICFENVVDSIATSKTNKHQTFVLELHVPTPLDSELLTYICAGEDKTGSVLAKQIKPEWIQKIFVYSKRGQTLLSHLFNDECPKTIELKPEIYAIDLPKISAPPLEAKTVEFPPRLILVKQGDILGSRMQTVVNTVNCVGVMGKGIALAFKQRYPVMFEDYKERCRRKEVKLGEPYLYKATSDCWILNFPTKNHWRMQSDIRDIEKGLLFLATHAIEWEITSLAVPPLGCGNGSLNWAEVYPLIRKYLDPLGMAIEIYAPFASTKAAPRIAESSSTITAFFEKNPKRKRKTRDELKSPDASLPKLDLK